MDREKLKEKKGFRRRNVESCKTQGLGDVERIRERGKGWTEREKREE